MTPAVFQFKKTRTAKLDVKRPASAKNKQDDEVMGTVQGQNPGSVQEWRCSKALDKLKLQYQYQKSIMGGRTVRGGQVIDFWVYTQPMPTPIYIQGSYWHRRAKAQDDDLKLEQLKRLYKGQIMEPQRIPEEELDSVERAFTSLRRRLLGQ